MDELRKAAQDVPYPGMREAFESHFGQSWTDRDWRSETSVWAAAWKAAIANAAPQDQDAKDAARWRFLTQQMDESEVDYLFCFDASDWAGRVDVAMQQEQKP